MWSDETTFFFFFVCFCLSQLKCIYDKSYRPIHSFASGKTCNIDGVSNTFSHCISICIISASDQAFCKSGALSRDWVDL